MKKVTMKRFYLLAFLLLVGCGYQENLPNTTHVQFNVVHGTQTQKAFFVGTSTPPVERVTLQITGQGIEPIFRSVSKSAFVVDTSTTTLFAIFEVDVPKLNGLVAEIEELDETGKVLFRGSVALNLEDAVFGQTVLVTIELADIISTAPPPEPTTFTLTVDKAGTGKGTVISDPTGINCGTDCNKAEKAYDTGTNVTLTAIPDTSSVFLGWSADCRSKTPVTEIIVTMDKTKLCRALFNPPP